MQRNATTSEMHQLDRTLRLCASAFLEKFVVKPSRKQASNIQIGSNGFGLEEHSIVKCQTQQGKMEPGIWIGWMMKCYYSVAIKSRIVFFLDWVPLWSDYGAMCPFME